MKYHPIGHSNLQASAVMLGTWATGGFQWGGTDKDESIRAIQTAIDEGINAIDTAPVYGFGESEIRVGKAIRGRRDRVILATKCGVVWHTDSGKFFYSADEKGQTTDGSGRKVFRYLHPQSIRYEIEQSLRRLDTDYIDLYQVHWMDDLTPPEQVMQTLLALKKEGKIRAIGLSNATVDHLRQYSEYGTIDSDQERYSLFDRTVESRNIPYCAGQGMAFIAYSPLFHGLLTGKFKADTHFEPGDFRATRLRFAPAYIEQVNIMISHLSQLRETYSTTAGALVLAYMLSRPGCTHVVVGARKPAQATENAQAGRLCLSATELKLMDDLFLHHLPVLPSGGLTAKPV